MRIYRTIAIATAVSATLITTAYAADSGQQSGGTTDQAQPSGDQSVPYNGTPLSSDQLSKEYQNLSPATRAALGNQLKSKGLDGLSSMSESDARTAFAGLPPEVRSQIQVKWDALSDEQRIALKKMGPAALKELVASQIKEAMKQSVDPAVQSAKTVIQKGRDYVQGLITKLKSQASQPDGQAQ